MGKRPKGKGKKKGTGKGQDGDPPITAAIELGDGKALSQLLQGSYSDGELGEVKVEKQRGEAFTGGVSTPVYEISRAGEKLYVAKVVRATKPLAIDSYRIEANFYSGPLRQFMALRERIKMPACLVAETTKDGLFTFLFDDLRITHPLHPSTFSVDQMKLALEALASFHGFFYANVDKLLTHAKHGNIWGAGTFWNLAKGDKDKVCNVGKSWQGNMRFIAKKFPDAAQEAGMKEFGARLEAAALALDHWLHPEPMDVHKYKGKRFVTLVHGDYKPANLFLNETQCGMLDFQFTGMGLGATDVAYLLFPDARTDFVEGEQALLKHYFEYVPHGHGRYSWDKFLLDFDLARLDYLRHLLGKGWVASTSAEVQVLQALNRALHRIDAGQGKTIRTKAMWTVDELATVLAPSEYETKLLALT